MLFLYITIISKLTLHGPGLDLDDDAAPVGVVEVVGYSNEGLGMRPVGCLAERVEQDLTIGIPGELPVLEPKI